MGISLWAGDCGRLCWLMELGEHLLPTLVLAYLCCRYALCALCRLSLEVFLTVLREAGSRGLCLESLAPVCPFLTGSALIAVSTLTTSPLLPGAAGRDWLCGARPHPAWKQKPGPERRVVPGSSASSPAWGRAGCQNHCTSLQRTEWFRLGPSLVSPWEAKRRWASGGVAGAPQAPSSQGLHSTGRGWVFLATL